jgi:hypothetical protein
MTPNAEQEHRIRDLAFELQESPGAKFLIAVSDDSGQRSRIDSELNEILRQTGRIISRVQASSLKPDVITALGEPNRLSSSDAIILCGLDTLSVQEIQQLFAQLNVHRDWLSKLELPLMIWISSELLNELAKIAPDFWSRRSGVYYFSERSVEDLLSRMFSQEKNKGPEWNSDPNLSDAFEAILSAEKELSDCLRTRAKFSIAKIDFCIEKVQGGVSQLMGECEKGRQIEIAFWLWGLGHLDNELQTMLDGLESTQRTLFESLYTDRNEVLLKLSQSLTEFLESYLEVLKENIKKKKRTSIVDRAREVAIAEIRQMAIQIVSSKEIPFTSDLEDWYASLQEDTQPEPQENAFWAQAADDLESWLAGEIEKLPPFFSSEEAVLLKLLYSKPADTNLIAQELGIPLRQATVKVRSLERKVRLYLGMRPRFTQKKSPARRAAQRHNG